MAAQFWQISTEPKILLNLLQGRRQVGRSIVSSPQTAVMCPRSTRPQPKLPRLASMGSFFRGSTNRPLFMPFALPRLESFPRVRLSPRSSPWASSARTSVPSSLVVRLSDLPDSSAVSSLAASD